MNIIAVETQLEEDKWVSHEYPDGRNDDKTTEMTTQSTNSVKDDYPVTTAKTTRSDTTVDTKIYPTESATEKFTFEGDYNTIEQHRVVSLFFAEFS